VFRGQLVWPDAAMTSLLSFASRMTKTGEVISSIPASTVSRRLDSRSRARRSSWVCGEFLDGLACGEGDGVGGAEVVGGEVGECRRAEDGGRGEGLGHSLVAAELGDRQVGEERTGPFRVFVIRAVATAASPRMTRPIKPGGHIFEVGDVTTVRPVDGKATLVEAMSVHRSRAWARRLVRGMGW